MDFENVVADDGYIELEWVQITLSGQRCSYCNKPMHKNDWAVTDHLESTGTQHYTCYRRRKRYSRDMHWNTGNPIVNGHTQ